MQSFWCDINKFDRVFSWISNLFKYIALLLLGDSRIDTNRGDSSLSEFINLIFHEGYKWGNDDSNPIEGYTRNLIGETLSATCWHKYECIVPRNHTLDDILLSLTKARKSEVVLEYGVDIWRHRISGKYIGVHHIDLRRESKLYICKWWEKYIIELI
jgi:hypothetical protein